MVTQLTEIHEKSGTMVKDGSLKTQNIDSIHNPLFFG